MLAKVAAAAAMATTEPAAEPLSRDASGHPPPHGGGGAAAARFSPRPALQIYAGQLFTKAVRPREPRWPLAALVAEPSLGPMDGQGCTARRALHGPPPRVGLRLRQSARRNLETELAGKRPGPPGSRGPGRRNGWGGASTRPGASPYFKLDGAAGSR
jgi:hypothetical protein